MTEFILKMVEVSPEPLLVGMLKDTIKEYERNPTELTFEQMANACSMIVTKGLMKRGGAAALSQNIKDVTKLRSAVNVANKNPGSN